MKLARRGSSSLVVGAAIAGCAAAVIYCHAQKNSSVDNLQDSSRIDRLVGAMSSAKSMSLEGHAYERVAQAMRASGFADEEDLAQYRIGQGKPSDFALLPPVALKALRIVESGNHASQASERGAIIVYSPGICGAPSDSGYIEINVGEGKGCGDSCGMIRACTDARIFLPAEIAPPSSEVASGDSAGKHAQALNGGVIFNGIEMCEFTWAERRGYADYSIKDPFHGVVWATPDRIETLTLAGSRRLAGKYAGSQAVSRDDTELMCRNARVLKPCYAKSTAFDKQKNSAFLGWTSQHKIDANIFKMAHAWVKTGLAGDSPQCNGGCDGVGMHEVASVIQDDLVETTAPTAVEWPGIAHNIITNIVYASRIFDAKIREKGAGMELVDFGNALLGVGQGTELEKAYKALVTCSP